MKHVALTAAALLLTASSAFAQTKDWLTLPLGPAQDLVLEKAGNRTARIPVRPADGASAPTPPLKVRLFDVSSKDGHGTTVAGEFEVKFVEATDKKDAAIEVSVSDKATEVLPGPYALSLKIAPDFNDAKSTQTLVVTLTAPPPQLSVDPVLIGVELAFLGLTDNTINKGELRLTEKGGKTPVRNAEATFTRDPVKEGQPDTGTLSFGPAVSIVGAGGVASAPVGVSGDFSPGKVAGKIDVRSRDLAGPISTTFEVRTRRSLIWILVLVTAGSAIGFFVRDYLTRRKALLEAAAVASSAVGLVDKELAATADPTYIAELNTLRVTMRDPVASKKAENVTKAATKLQEDLIAARGRFEQRLQPLAQSAIALHNLTDKQWEAPPFVMDALKELHAMTEKLSATLAQRNADGAKELLTNVVPNSLLAALKAVDKAGANLSDIAQTVVANSSPMLDGDFKHLSDATDVIARRFPSPAPKRVDATVDQLFAALSAWTVEGSVARAHLVGLGTAAQRLLVWAKDQLQPPPDANLEALGVKTAAELEAAKLREQAELESPDVVALQARLTQLRADWRQYFVAKGGAKLPAADLDAAIKRSAWADAVGVVRDAAAPKALGPGAVQASQTAPTGGSAAAAAGLPSQRGEALGFQPASLLLGTGEERASLLNAARRASWIQTFLLGVLFVVGVYCLYRETWTGSDKEMLALFMLAFGLDLTADSVAGAFKKLKMPDI
jgi:hypothetical protein